MNRTRVGVLRGGPSSEYEVSLKTGAAVLRHLPEERFEAVDVFIDRSGIWHAHGVPVTPAHLGRRVDVVFNALHGAYGEDGTVQRELEWHGIPYTGSRVAPSAIAMHKARAKEHFRLNEIRTPLYRVLRTGATDAEIHDLFRSLPLPYIVKPVRAGSSHGISLVRSFGELQNALSRAREHGDVLVEEYIGGREGSVGVVEGFRGEELYALPPVEIIPPEGHDFFDEEVNYGGAEEIVPGNFTPEEKREIEKIAKTVHRSLGLRHYSRSDFIVPTRPGGCSGGSSRGIYVLEVNTLPGLTDESLLPKAVDAVGVGFPEFLEHLIALALTRR